MNTYTRAIVSAVLVSVYTLDGLAQDRTRETRIDEHFSVSEGGLLEVRVSDADVNVTTGSSNDVHVTVVLEGSDMERAREYYERQHITASKEGNTVRVDSKPERYNQNWSDWRSHPNIEVEVSVPGIFNADIRSSDGDLTLGDLRGNVDLKTSDGDVSTGSLQGESIAIQTSDGEVSVGSIVGKTVELKTSDGELTLRDVTADRIVARTSDGDISAEVVSGEAEFKTSDGSISLVSFEGPALHVRTSAGSIHVDRLASASCVAQASDGEISIRDADGDLDVSTSSGDIRLELGKAGAVTARTSDGDVMIVVPKGLGADLSLRGENVEVEGGHEFEGRMEEEHAEGQINGGGPPIKASTSDGTVSVRVR